VGCFVVKILLADDHKLLREGVRSLLEKQDEFEIVGEAEDGRETVKLAINLAPDVIIMDITMPNLNGIDATAQLKKEIPDSKVVALSMHKDKNFIEEMLRAGASGYLLKENSSKELIEAINTVLANKTYLSSEINDIVVKDFVDHLAAKKELSPSKSLTLREREILQLIAEGNNTKKIASILNISTKTVETHRLHITQKLKIYTVAGLTRFAIREGLTSFDDLRFL